MLVGYNTNVPYKGTLYHVQTEDYGLKNPVVITLLYDKGSILASRKTSYADLASSPEYKEKVREMMKEQHKNMIKGLIHGEFTGSVVHGPQGERKEITDKEQMTGRAQENGCRAQRQISKSLDDILIDYIIKGGE